MSLRRAFCPFALFCALVSFSADTSSAAEPAAPRVAAPKVRPHTVRRPEADEAVETEEPISAEDAKEIEKSLARLDLQTAELFLRLNELDLQKIDDLNKKMAGLYADAEVDRFRTAVEMARQRVVAARKVAEGHEATAVVGVGEAALKNASDAYDRARNANQRLANTYGAVDIERLRLGVEVAKTNLAKAKLVAKLDSPVAVVHWELEELREELRQLRLRITAITSRR